MRIDAHQHFWKYDAVRDAWITAEMSVLQRDYLPSDLVPELVRNEITGTIAVQADQSESETAFLLSLAERHSFILGVVGWVDLRSPLVGERLEYYSRFERLVGFRHIVQAEPDDLFLLRQDLMRGLRLLQSFGYSYDLLVYPRQMHAAIELAHRLPDLRLVLDHIGKPPIRDGVRGPWRQQIHALAENPNVYCKLSGLVTEADWKRWTPNDCKPYLDAVFEAFGPERLIFGSDWPVCLLAAGYGQVTSLIAEYAAQCGSGALDAIMGSNAISFYRVKTTACI
ncbi:MAG: amidohydrolase family protein [Terriglobales bacterium]